ncbi:hypothetical protein HYZ78_03035 [Candidatus Microgenomates bacterium]|nr:hypothetical protein [Candidatus Microgenomates bacterium]
MKPIDLRKILSKYTSGWIALTPDNRKFIANANSLKEVISRANKRGVPDPTVFKAVSNRQFFVG